VDVAGTLKVAGYNVFGAIQPAVDAVASGASIDVASGSYAENVVVNGLRNLAFDNVALEGLTFLSGAAGSGIRGSVTANGATGFLFSAPVVLLGDTSLATAGANISFGGDIQGAYALSLDAGTGDVTLVSGGTQVNPLGRLEVDADNFSLQGTLWVSGYDIDALGTVALSNSTLRSVGGGGTDAINAGGDVTGSTISESGVQIQSAANVAANVLSQGAVVVEAVKVSGNYTAPTIAFQVQDTVNVNVNATGPVQVTSGGPATLFGEAPFVDLRTPGAVMHGDFGQVTNSGSGLVEVNGRPQLNPTLAVSASNNRVVPQEVTTAASPEASAPQRTGGSTVRRRRKPEDALDVLDNGEAMEIDLTPG
jgi:hypothetical protein